MEIRIAEQNDYQELMSLLIQLNPDDPITNEQTHSSFEDILDSEYFHIIVAENNKKLLASCYLNIIPNLTREGKPYSLIENVITDLEYRNQGIGKKVIEFALNLSWSKNCYKVMLMSGRKEESVHSFYRSCGFDGSQKHAYVQRSE